MTERNEITIQSVSKSFAGVKALDQVSLDIVGGRVHGLIGANGAGKSTLIKILAGVYQRDEGDIRINGKPVTIGSPAESAALGMSFIHQELNMVEHFNVVENLLLGLPKDKRFGMIDWKKTSKRVENVLQMVKFDKPLTTPIMDLSTGDQWLIAIAKALYQNAKFIGMDEPTAALSEAEVDNLFHIVRSLTEQGIGVIYVSHRLDEVIELCDEVTVFKEGKKIFHSETSALTKEDLVTAIAGHKIEAREAIAYQFQNSDELLRVDGLTDEKKLHGISFSLKKGEVLGITGLVGAGRTETIMAVYGARKLKEGTMTFEGKPYSPRTSQDAVRSGIALVPENRREEGLVTNQTVDFNVNLPALEKTRILADFPFTSPLKSEAVTRETAEKLQIKTDGPQANVLSLSGGNQQKVVIGKWMQREIKLMIMDEPTQGVDVGARAEIYRLIREMAQRDGISFLIVSSDLEELPGLCDRVIVLAEGRVMGELTGEDINQHAMLRLCYAADKDRRNEQS